MKNDIKGYFGIIFTDVMISFFGLTFLILAIFAMMPHDNKISNPEMGSVCAELFWDNDADIDLDLWGKAPSDDEGVGYSNMHGKNLDLLKDVIGFSNNPEHINLEIECSKFREQGEWTFNVHFYSNHIDQEKLHTIKANMVIITINKNNTKHIIKTDWNLTSVDEEKTMFDFNLDANGDIIPSSINSFNKPLRNR